MASDILGELNSRLFVHNEIKQALAKRVHETRHMSVCIQIIGVCMEMKTNCQGLSVFNQLSIRLSDRSRQLNCVHVGRYSIMNSAIE